MDFLKLDYENFPGFSKRDLFITQIGRQIRAWSELQPAYLKNWAKSMSDSEIMGRVGCTASHIALWKHMLACGIDTALILEDDVDIHIDFLDLLTAGIETVPTDWDLIFPGYCSHKFFPDGSTTPPKDDSLIHRLTRAACGHAYMIRRTTIETFLKSQEIMQPNYETAWDVHMAHLISDRVIPNAYGFTPPIVAQRPRSLAHQSLVTPLDGNEEPANGSAVDASYERGWRYRDRLKRQVSAAHHANVSYWHDLDED